MLSLVKRVAKLYEGFDKPFCKSIVLTNSMLNSKDLTPRVPKYYKLKELSRNTMKLLCLQNPKENNIYQTRSEN